MRLLRDDKLDTLYEQLSVRLWKKFPAFFTQEHTYWWDTQCFMWPAGDDIEDELWDE